MDTSIELPLAGVASPGRGAGFSLFMWLTRVNLIVFLLNTVCYADTFSHSYVWPGDGQTYSHEGEATLISTPTGFQWNLSVLVTGNPGSSYASIRIELVDSDNSNGVIVSTLTVTKTAGDGFESSSTQGTTTSQGRTHWRARFSDDNGYQVYGTTHELPVYNPEYYVKVVLPYNASPVRQIFYALQNGIQVGSKTVAHNEGPVTWVIGPLETDDPVTVRQYAGGELETDAEGNYIATEDTDYFNAGPAITPTESAPPSQGTDVGMKQPAVPNYTPIQPPASPTPTAPPSAVTPTAAPTAPTPKTVPTFNPTPTAPSAPTDEPEDSGDAGADQITSAINAHRAEDHERGVKFLEGFEAMTLTEWEIGKAVIENQNEGNDKTVAAVAKSIESTDKIAAAVADAGTKQVEATDKVADAMSLGTEALLQALNAINLNIAQQDQKDTAPTEDQKAEKLTEIINYANSARTTAQQAAEVFPTTGTVRADDTSKGADMQTITLPANPGKTISLNPLDNANVKTLAGLLRALIGWAVLIALVSWTYIKIPKWFTEALRGGTGITVWRSVTGALPMAGFVLFVGLMTAFGTILFTAPTLLWAAADPYLMGSAGTALIDVRDIISDNGGTGAVLMISLIDACCPVGLCMAAFFNWVGLQIAGQAIVAGLVALQKVLTSG